MLVQWTQGWDTRINYGKNYSTKVQREAVSIYIEHLLSAGLCPATCFMYIISDSPRLPSGQGYYLHFADGETEAQRV